MCRRVIRARVLDIAVVRAGDEGVDLRITSADMSTITTVVCSERTRLCFRHRRWVRVVFRLRRVKETVLQRR